MLEVLSAMCIARRLGRGCLDGKEMEIQPSMRSTASFRRWVNLGRWNWGSVSRGVRGRVELGKRVCRVAWSHEVQT